MLTKSEIGKKSRAAGKRFETKVREDLEKKGYIVDRWTNNVKFEEISNCCGVGADEDSEVCPECKEHCEVIKNGDIIPSKPKYNPFTKSLMMNSAGFPDFIAFKQQDIQGIPVWPPVYDVIGVEAKSNGKLDKTEKEKCRWLLDNHIFSKILISKKGEKRGEIEYVEF